MRHHIMYKPQQSQAALPYCEPQLAGCQVSVLQILTDGIIIRTADEACGDKCQTSPAFFPRDEPAVRTMDGEPEKGPVDSDSLCHNSDYGISPKSVMRKGSLYTWWLT